MAGLAPGRTRSPEVRKLAEDIEKAQDPEIETMSGWLTSWGEEVPAEGAMDYSMHGDMEGMMSAEEMDKPRPSRPTVPTPPPRSWPGTSSPRRPPRSAG